MTYRTLTCLHRTDRASRHVLGAADFARRHAAHLDVLVLADTPLQSTLDMVRTEPYHRSRSFTRLIDDAESAADDIRTTLVDEDIRHSVTIVCEPASQLETAIGQQLLATDLVLMEEPQTLLAGVGAKCLGGALFHAGKPALVLRDGTKDPTASIAETRTALIAWHGSRECARAVQLALPLLAEAASVRLLQIGDLGNTTLDEQRTSVDLWLTRHGIDITNERLPRSGDTIAATLAQRLCDPEVDLAVMGAYGRSPLLESWFAGTTHRVLKEGSTNLFIAH